ncbi:unnamed protein product [Trichogramma brassicae]|uniref:Uncharacterized protein n=1 Tax=Trichogramma brassicae TaxID=86971 RepID=A0A6H5IZC2_9HYME|nr:unnamed protein product [Trichogramma brassicae]
MLNLCSLLPQLELRPAHSDTRSHGIFTTCHYVCASSLANSRASMELLVRSIQATCTRGKIDKCHRPQPQYINRCAIVAWLVFVIFNECRSRVDPRRLCSRIYIERERDALKMENATLAMMTFNATRCAHRLPRHSSSSYFFYSPCFITCIISTTSLLYVLSRQRSSSITHVHKAESDSFSPRV